MAEEQHGHIAAHAVTLAGNVAERFDRGTAQSRFEGVQLSRIGPGRKVGIPAAGDDLLARPEEAAGHPLKIIIVSLNEIFGMLQDPWMIAREVIGNKIQHEANAPLCKQGSGPGQAFRTPQVAVYHVTTNAIWRSYHVPVGIVGQCFTKGSLQVRFGSGNEDARWAPLPDPHKPHGIDAQAAQAFPFFRRDIAQSHQTFVAAAKFGQPDPCVDLIDDRLPGPSSYSHNKILPRISRIALN